MWRHTCPLARRVVLAARLALGLSVTLTAGADGQTLQDYRVAHWTTADGLPQNTINDIMVLPNGDLWLATFGGLVRFNGAGFQVVDIARDEALPSNRITAMVPAGDDAAWFVTQEGHLGRLEGGRVRTLFGSAGPMGDVVGFVAAGSQFYAQTEEGSIWTSDGTQPWHPLMAASPPGSAGPNFLAQTDREHAWASFDRTLVPLSSTGAVQPRPLPVETLAITEGAGGDLWLSLRKGVARYREGHIEMLDVRPAIETTPSAILHVSDAELWVAGDGIVSRLTTRPDGVWTRADLPLGLSREIVVRALAVDGEGSIWIGTNGLGLLRASRQPTQRFGSQEGLAAITALASDGGRGAWVSSSTCSGVFHIDEHGTVLAVHRSGDPTQPEPGGCRHAFAPAGGGDVWVRWQRHLYRLSRGASRVTKLPVALPSEAGPIVTAADGTVWVVSRNGDVRRVSADRVLEQVTLPAPLTAAVLATDGTLWVGGTGQVFRVVGGGRPPVRIGATEGVPRGSVRDILVDPDGTVWIATYGGGLGRWRDGRVTRLTVNEGLPDNSHSRVLDDGRGRLWVATNRGIAVLERTEIEEVAGAWSLQWCSGRNAAYRKRTSGCPRGSRAPTGTSGSARSQAWSASTPATSPSIRAPRPCAWKACWPTSGRCPSGRTFPSPPAPRACA
jgi:ligand-binding sensor domain-containing protein